MMEVPSLPGGVRVVLLSVLFVGCYELGINGALKFSLQL